MYRYEYARAVREGYLVDYDVVPIKSDVRMKGVFLKDIGLAEVVHQTIPLCLIAAVTLSAAAWLFRRRLE